MNSTPNSGDVTSETAFRATLAVTAVTMASHALGLVRESTLAGFFGAGVLTDVYFVALMIPNIVSSVLAAGIQTVGTSLLGEYVYRKEKRSELGDVAWGMFHLTLLIVASLAVLAAVLIPPVLAWIAPGFTADQVKLAMPMTVILSFLIVFIGLGGWCQSVLQIFQKFTPTAMSHIYFNGVMITSIFAAGKIGSVIALAAGMLAASAALFFSQLPATLKSLPPYRMALNIGHPAVRNFARQMVPVSIRMVAQMSNSIVERFLASRLVSGSISALEYASRTFQLPVSAFGNTVVTVLYSAMTAFRSGGETERFTRAYVRGLRMLAFIFIPVTVGLIMFRTEVVRLLFERGAFDRAATELTATALIYYSAGLLFTVWRSHTTQALAALQDFITPLWATLIAIGSNVALNFWLVRHLDHGGIALGKSLAEVIWFLILARQMRVRVGSIGGMDVLKSSVRIGVAAALAGAAVIAARAMPVWSDMESAFVDAVGRPIGAASAVAASLALLAAAYFAAFWGISRAMNSPELSETTELIRRALSKSVPVKPA